MATKFLEVLEKYYHELGLTEAVPGATNVMTPSTPTVQPNLGKVTVDDLAKQEQDHLKTTQDIMKRIETGTATPEDYKALSAASAGLDNIQQTKAKLTSAQKPNSASPSTNPLNKPLV